MPSDKGSHMHHTVNPRISPLGAYLFSILDGGSFEGGLYKGGGLIESMLTLRKIIKRPCLF